MTDEKTDPKPEPVLSTNGFDKTETYGFFKPRTGSTHYGRMMSVNWDIADAALATIDAKLAVQQTKVDDILRVLNSIELGFQKIEKAFLEKPTIDDRLNAMTAAIVAVGDAGLNWSAKGKIVMELTEFMGKPRDK